MMVGSTFSPIMGTKAQHATSYERLPTLLRTLREEAGLTQRELGEKLGKPQSWVYNCETLNCRVDVAEFVDWVTACGVEPVEAFARFLASGRREAKVPSSGPRKK